MMGERRLSALSLSLPAVLLATALLATALLATALLATALLVAGLPTRGGFAQETSPQEEIQKLVEQLRDEKFEIREQAMRRLIELGSRALPALERAALDNDAEVSYRAKRAIRAISVLEPAQQADLRDAGDRALHSGDNAEMVRVFRRLCTAANASLDDHRMLGHAHRLGGRWKEAAEAYTEALEKIDRLLDGERQDGERPEGGGEFPRREQLLRQRVALIIVLGRIHHRLLDDPKTAERTYALVSRHSELLTKPLDELADTWKSMIAEARDSGKSIGSARVEARQFEEVYYLMFALRELAETQELNGKHAEALETLRRICLTTQCYQGNADNRDLVAIERLLNQQIKVAADDSGGAIVIHAGEPTVAFDLTNPNSLAKAYANDNEYWTFCVAPPSGKEFATLRFDCDIEQLEHRYGGQFESWALIGDDDPRRMNLGSIGWAADQPLGRAVRSKTFELEPGTGAVHFKSGSWDGKFQVHEVQVSAAFRARAAGVEPPPRPTPGYVIQNECLPQGGTLTLDGEPYMTAVASHDVKPGRHRYTYAHPERKNSQSFEAEFKPGGWYGLFINLDSPLESKLTNLRGFDEHGSSFVQRKDGRWLVAWHAPADGTIHLAGSDDLVTWSEPWRLAESGLFGAPFTCLCPSLYVDEDGTIWMAYFSNRLDLIDLHSGGYRLFLTHSKDGREWATPRVLRMPFDGWPPGSVQMTTAPDGKFWMIYRLFCATAESPEKLATFEPLAIAGDENIPGHARNPHAAFGADGRVHLVWDHFGRKIYYSRRSREGEWSRAVEVPGASGQVSSPRLLAHGDKLLLLYAQQGAVLRTARITDSGLDAGEPIKITDHVAPLTSLQPQITRDGRIAILCGKDTVWLRAADEGKLFRHMFGKDGKD